MSDAFFRQKKITELYLKPIEGEFTLFYEKTTHTRLENYSIFTIKKVLSRKKKNCVFSGGRIVDSLCGCEPDSVVGDVKVGVELPHEDVSEDGANVAGEGRHAHDAADACGLAELCDLEDVVLRLQGVLHTSEGQVQVGEGRQVRAHREGALNTNVGAVELPVDEHRVNQLHRNERRAGVNDSLERPAPDRLRAEHHGVPCDLPVPILGHVVVHEVACVVVRVSAPKDKLALDLRSARKVEAEGAVVNKLLVNEGVEHRNNPVHADLRPAKTENSVESACNPCRTRLLGRLGKDLALGGKPAEGHSVDVREALHSAGAVQDLPLSPVLDVRRGHRAVVLLVCAPRAGGAGHPQVGGPRVEHDLEDLLRRSDGHRAEVLCVHEVRDVLDRHAPDPVPRVQAVELCGEEGAAVCSLVQRGGLAATADSDILLDGDLVHGTAGVCQCKQHHVGFHCVRVVAGGGGGVVG